MQSRDVPHLAASTPWTNAPEIGTVAQVLRRLALVLSLAFLAALSLVPAGQAATLDAGGEHACAVKTNGTVWCWGSNDFGELGTADKVPSAVPVQIPGIADATSVATGGAFSCVLRAGGTVLCWGQNLYGQLGHESTSEGDATPHTGYRPLRRDLADSRRVPRLRRQGESDSVVLGQQRQR